MTLLFSLLACSGPVQPLSRAEAPMDVWLTLHGLPGHRIAMRAPQDVVWVDGDTVELTMPTGRWGAPTMTLVVGRGPAGQVKTSLANGATVSYTIHDAVSERLATSTLRGTLDLKGRPLHVVCTHQAEAEQGGAQAQWCLRVLASARLVDPAR